MVEDKLILKWSLDGIVEVQKEKTFQSISCMTCGTEIRRKNRVIVMILPL